MDFNFIKLEKNETPKTKLSNRTYFDENSIHLNLLPNETYCLYFHTKEDITSIDSILLLDSEGGEIDIFNNCNVNKILNKYFHLTFNFPSEYSSGCQQLKFIINGTEIYYSTKFTIREYNKEDTILLNWWHKENKNTIPYFDFQDEIYYTQRLRVNLRFISKYDELKTSSAEDTINRNYHLIGSYRSIEIPLELYTNYTSIEHHQYLARILSSDFVYFENQRYKMKKYDFKEDDDERGIVTGKVEVQLIEDDIFDFDADVLRSNLRMLSKTNEHPFPPKKFQDYLYYDNYIHNSPVSILNLENKLFFELEFYFNQDIEFLDVNDFSIKINENEFNDSTDGVFISINNTFLSSESILSCSFFRNFFIFLKQNDFNSLTIYKNKIRNTANTDLYFGKTIKFYIKRPPKADVIQVKATKDLLSNRINFTFQEEIFNKLKLDFIILLIYENNTLVEIVSININGYYYDGFIDINNSFKIEVYLLKRLGISEEPFIINI